MENLENLKSQQEQKANEIQKIISNIKKAPHERRTVEFYQKKSQELTDLWKAFERTENVIRHDPSLPEDDTYIKKDLYKSIGAMYSATIDEVEAIIADLGTKSKPSPAARASLQEDTIIHQGLARRIRARMVALQRFLNGLSSVEDGQPRQFYKIKIETINGLWNQIQSLYDEIWQHLDNPSESGLDQQEYYSLEDLVQHYLVSLSVKADKSEGTFNKTSMPHNTLPLPKVTIPQFDGNCLKWRQFYELFSEMVDKQSLPNVQKMWYLKTNLSGEAANLISHLTLTEENYSTAWKLLQERYNNKRILVATLVEKIVSQPTGISSTLAIKNLHDTTRECLLALQNLDIDTTTWDAIVLQLLTKKLERNLYMRFIQSLIKPKEVPTIVEFLAFLELQFQSMEAAGQKTNKAVSSVATSAENVNLCKMCNESHRLYNCNKFLHLSEAERLQWVQRQKLCVNCFKSDHSSRQCNSGSCKICTKKHNTLLHLKKSSNKSTTSSNKQQTSNTINETSAANASAVSSTTTRSSEARQGYVMLATANVIIKGPNGVSGKFRAVLDSGSQVNLVTERLVRKLSISPVEAVLCIDGVGNIHKRSTHRINVEMKSTDGSFSTNLEAFILPNIIPAQPNLDIDVSSWSIPNHIQMADPNFNKQSKIDILLGAEFFFSLTLNGSIKLADDLPILQNTALGWIIGGTIGQHKTSNALTCAVFDSNASLEQAIEQLWKLDEVEPSEKIMSPAERQCETHFTQHVQTNADGRFIVRLPFRENPSVLGESHSMAYNRFISLERRFQKDELVRAQYIQFMREYEQLGHMEKVNLDDLLDSKYFIPHHCVLKPDSTTTKLRVVFDASAKTSAGYSLNDLMFTGPTVQSELFSILLRFRMPKFVFTTDIQKMYRQILIHPENHQYQLIIWRENPSSPINYYKLKTVTYGTRSAPYLATKCLQKIADENTIHYPFGSQMLRENFYVDDGLGGSDSLNIALETQRELIQILQKRGFILKKWCANNSKLLKDIPQGDMEVNLDFSNNENNTIKTLGLLWLPKTDHFCVKVKLNQIQTITKRTVTSDLAKLFDPLGLLAPVVVKAKIFIQGLWQLKLDWDEPLPEDLCAIWGTFRTDLESLSNFKIPRHVFNGEIPTKTQLHLFADASEKAYGAVAYIRATLRDGRIIVRLLCAKSRVAPLKKQTLPRLELCAALIAAELAQRVQYDIKLQGQQLFLWTDSEIVLSWINSQSSSFKTFVANKVATIQSMSFADQWRHVKSKDNPADILSRGLRASNLSSCNLWFQGPLFLHGKQELWPTKFLPQLQMSTDLEKKTNTSIVLVSSNCHEFIYKIQHKGSFKILQRIVSYVIRFIRNSKIEKSLRPSLKALIPAELDDALTAIIRAIQGVDFQVELRKLEQKQEVDKQSSLSSLSPFIDESGVIRVGGRLEESPLPYSSKHPIILPYNDILVKLLFRKIHEENKHCGPQALLGIMRQRFWPIKGKITARSTVQKCVQCTKARPQLCEQIMGNLPKERVTPSRPFINTGVDYCGPLWIHYKIRGKRPTKAYLAVFCCFATKAVHLELVSDLSTDAFIGSLKRFISRRGRCQNIYCDNATNFVGASNKLSELVDSIYSEDARESIVSKCSANGIQFHFIPPRAPHFGGLWEAAVKSAKHHLIRSTTSASLTYEELETVIVEIEAILNSRPLTPLSNDPSDLTALTPGHLLIGEALTAQVDSKATDRMMSLQSRWQIVSQIKHNFWNQWSRDYLHELQQKHKWKNSSPNLKPGDMVIIKEDNTPVMKWPLGRIINTYHGNDGSTRVADVKTAAGTFKRAIHRLAVLPIESSEKHEPDSNKVIEPDIIQEKHTTEPDEPRAKRTCLIQNQTFFTILAMLFMLPIVLGSPIDNKRFGSKLGIHFEKIGSTSISTSSWNIFVYYDLSNYWTETTLLLNGKNSMLQICKKMEPNITCANVLSHFELMINDLDLENQLLYKTRARRGAIDFVGNVAHSLFGVLDSEYAKEMSSTIQDLKENESYVLRLLNSQTSVVNSTINIIKQGLLSTKQSFAQLHWEINAINKSLHYIDDGLYQIRLTQLFNAGIMQLSLIANNLQRTKSSILDALTDTHHGKVSPLLLTPTQLEKEINQIKHHLPQKTDLPVPMKDILELYKLMRIKGGITKQHVLFSITLPLVDQIKFDIYNLIPIPNWINDSMVMIDPCDSMLAINIEREQYFLVSTLLLKSCDAIRSDVFLCYNIQLRYHFGAETCSCEINLFNNNTLPTCTLKTIRTNVTWIPLAHQNQWIYTAASSTQATAVCDKEIIPLNLEGSGLLKIKPECILKHDFIHVAGQRLITTTLNHSYSSLGNFRELSTGKFTKNPMYLDKNLPVFSENYAAQMKELTNLQQKIQMQTEHPLQYHSQHGIAVSYAALLTSISAITVILIIYVSYKKSRQYLVSNMLQQNPSVIHTHEDNVQGAPSPLPRMCSPDRAPASAGEDV